MCRSLALIWVFLLAIFLQQAAVQVAGDGAGITAQGVRIAGETAPDVRVGRRGVQDVAHCGHAVQQVVVS